MSAPIPSPLPKWAKALLKPDNIFFSPVLLAAVDFLGSFNTSDSSAPSIWQHVQMEWQLTGQTIRADHFVTTFDIAKISGGSIQGTWNAGDFTAVETQLETLFTDWQAQAIAGLQRTELRFYTRSFNPLSDPKPYPPSGPPSFVKTYTPGSGSSAYNMIAQGACTHTEHTPYRRHWGRVYWPVPNPSIVTDSGRFTPGLADGLALAVHNVYDALMAAEFFPVVPVTQVEKAPSRSLLTVNAVSVDDVPDVVRRRRPKYVGHKTMLPVGP